MTGVSPRAAHTTYQVDGHVCLRLTGEIDMQVESTVASWFRETVTRHPGKDLIVDLAGVSFLDSSGIRQLMDAHRELTDQGAKMIVTGARGVVLTVLKVTGVYEALSEAEIGGKRC
jgi:anti-sigma B factor antagonist